MRVIIIVILFMKGKDLLMKDFNSIRREENNRILIAAHRGACGGNIPCNTMTAFETAFLCLMIPLVYVLSYLAGKCDFLNVVCLMMREWAKKTEEAIKNDEDT